MVEFPRDVYELAVFRLLDVVSHGNRMNTHLLLAFLSYSTGKLEVNGRDASASRQLHAPRHAKYPLSSILAPESLLRVKYESDINRLLPSLPPPSPPMDTPSDAGYYKRWDYGPLRYSRPGDTGRPTGVFVRKRIR